MDLNTFKQEICRFLARPERGVLVITGKWGVGKTYAWKRIIEEAAQQGGIAYTNYAYVSLFGLETLEDARAAIFENTVPISRLSTPPDLETFSSRLADWRKAFKALKFVPSISQYAVSGRQIGSLLTKNQIVCIDDLERAGPQLQPKEVLGLATHLAEERACQVILILNEEGLPDNARPEFLTHVEKSAEAQLRLEPSASDAASIGLDPSSGFYQILFDACVSLKILNVRTIRKIHRLAVRLEEELRRYDERVLKDALRSMCLYCFAKFQPNSSPPTDFIRNYYRDFQNDLTEDETRQRAEWGKFLHSYGYGYSNDFDLIIFDGIEAGAFDLPKLHEAARNFEQQLKIHDDDKMLTDAWSIFHSSFGDDQNLFVEALTRSIERNPNVVSPGNLSSSIEILKDLGYEDVARDVLATYVANHTGDANFWRLKSYPFKNRVTDSDVVNAFREKAAQTEDVRNPRSVLIELGKDRTWNMEDELLLAQQDEDFFYRTFKELDGDNLKNAVRGGLLFQDIRHASEEKEMLTAKVVSALKKIAEESPINQLRVRLWLEGR